MHLCLLGFLGWVISDLQWGYSPCPGGLGVFLLYMPRVHSSSLSLQPCWPSCCCHCHNLSVLLFLQHCKQHCLWLAFIFSCCCLLCKPCCLFETQLFCHRGGKLLAFKPFFLWSKSRAQPMTAVWLSCSPPCNHMVFCDHFALPYLRFCCHHFFSITFGTDWAE